jgi:hypothetical protein
VAPPNFLGAMVLTILLLYYMTYSFHVNFNIFGSVVLEKKIFKIFFLYTHICNSFHYCGPIRPPGAIILTNLLLNMY